MKRRKRKTFRLPKYQPAGDVCEVPLTQGAVALVDAEVYDWLMQWKWCIGAGGYAVRGERRDGKQVQIKMHRELLGLPRVYDGVYEGDHMNGDRLDNRRENLRVLTLAQNRQNRRPQRSSTGVRNVIYSPTQGYVVKLEHAGVRYYFGAFKTLEEAEPVAVAARRQVFPYAVE